MKKIRAAVVGYGNIGKYALEALETAPDFEVAGIVRRNGAENKPAELAQYDVVKDIRELKDVDVAILATPTRSCEEYANQILPLGINTVDSFDIHTQIRGYRERLPRSQNQLLWLRIWRNQQPEEHPRLEQRDADRRQIREHQGRYGFPG